MPPTPEEWAQAMIERARELGTDVLAIVSGPFSWKELLAVLVALARAAEQLFGAGAGLEKRAAVQAVLDHLKAEYDLVNKIDDLIKLPFWAEPFDGKAIDVLLNMAVEGVVFVINLVDGWVQPAE